ncbi:glycosyltransferase family 4 protein [Kocuria sp.]|uniref:glycosyltransferase family 4 protein n=1 Tax=Kocuria sp. TaxID=1871328 RepID=UPI0026E0D100|nr:glycosyltransferase family 4 protein [Kocuria sp.]MDO5617444.1 glycosyltransferase family 4 protein [Kocuria sp.]
MRLAYISADPGIPVFGSKGASVHVQEIIRCWRAMGWEVTVYATRIGDQVPADLTDLEVVHVPVPAVPAVAAQVSEDDRTARVIAREVAQQHAAQAIAAQVIAAGVDAVYERYSLFSTALAEVTETLSVPGFLEVNAPLIDEQRTHRDLVDQQSAYAALDRQVGAATRIACVSEPVAQWVRTTAGPGSGLVSAQLAERVVVTPNGVNVQRIGPSLDSGIGGPDPQVTGTGLQVTGPGPLTTSPDSHADSPSAERVPTVVFVGTLKPWHGVEHLLQARALATRAWRLRLVGDGPQRESLTDQARQLGIEVEFTGAVAPDRIPDHLMDCAVAVAPYPRTEQSMDQYFSPLKIYEYCAAALPVVASRVGQVPAIIDDGVTGLLVAPSDPADLARAVDELVGDPGRRRAMGRAARDMAVRERSWETVLAAILADTELAVTGGRP